MNSILAILAFAVAVDHAPQITPRPVNQTILNNIVIVADHCANMLQKGDVRDSMERVILESTGTIPSDGDIDQTIMYSCMSQSFDNLLRQLGKNIKERSEEI